MRDWFVLEDFELVSIEAPDDKKYRGVAHRYTGEPRPYQPGRTFSAFTH